MGYSPWLLGELPGPWSAVFSAAPQLQLACGMALFYQGDAREWVYLVREGRVRVQMLTPAGNEQTLYVAGAGVLLGEGAQPGTSHPYGAVAVVDAVVQRVQASQFAERLRHEPGLAAAVMTSLEHKAAVLAQQLSRMGHGRTTRRIAQALLDLAACYGTPGPLGIRLNVPFTQQEMADLVATTRVTVNKALQQWSRAGILDRQGRHYLVRDPEALRRLAEWDGAGAVELGTTTGAATRAGEGQ